MAKIKKNSVKKSKTEKAKVSMNQKNGKVTKKQTSKKPKGGKSNLKREIVKTRDAIEKSNQNYDAIQHLLMKQKEDNSVKVDKKSKKRKLRKDPVDLENSFDQIAQLCRTKINISQ